MGDLEYLLSYGLQGDFGRFRSARPLFCQRGDAAVVRSHRGLELGRVLGPARPGHARFLPNTSVGQLLRLATMADEEAVARGRERGRTIFERGRTLAAQQNQPLELLDVEVLLDGEHVVLHLLRDDGVDVRPFVSTISREFAVHVLVEDWTWPGHGDEAEDHGCGRENCGRAGGEGGCSSCGSDGGCATCGVARPEEVTRYFAGLREQMERRRTNLL
jgi:cell fate regulator YaaT (PSP1 superfamily)